MRASAAVLALCLAVPYAAMPAQADNNNLDIQKAMQDIAAAVKETGDKAAESVATTAEQVKQAIDKLKQELEEHHKPIEDTLSQAAHEVVDTVKEGAAHVGETISQAAAAIKEELSDANHAGLSDDPCWKACTREMMPLCGSDGVSYSNKCVFEIAQCRAGGEGMLKVDHQGRCNTEQLKKDPASCLKACTRDYRPVCASDGKTYSNKCVFEIAQCVAEVSDQTPLTLLHIGKCEDEVKDSCPQFCTMEFSPVCGSNGQTYGNRCALNMAACKHPDQNIEVAHVGECLSEAASAANAAPEPTPADAKMDPRLLVGLIVAATLLTALVAVFAARKVHLRRFTRITTQEVAPAAGKLPAYSRLLTEDQLEDDPDELFPPEYSAEGYTSVKTTSSRP